jgi:fructokinase
VGGAGRLSIPGDRAAARIGVDLGGTKIEGIVLGRDGAVLAGRRIPSPRGDYEASLAAIRDLVAALEADARLDPGAATVGIGIPGSISPVTGHVQGANSTWLNGRNLATDLEGQIGRPVRLANDANCFALSEAVDGAGAGAKSVFGVILGTGCGGGLVLDGRLIDGPNAIGGEWGHNPLPWARADEHPGPRCWCGRSGCMETWVSGPGMAADHLRQTGQSLTAEEIAAHAAAGDTTARATLTRHAERLGRGLAHVVNIVDPHVIVLGGGLSKLAGLYSVLPALVAAHVFAAQPIVDIRPPRWGDASGVRGAAWLW